MQSAAMYIRYIQNQTRHEIFTENIFFSTALNCKGTFVQIVYGNSFTGYIWEGILKKVLSLYNLPPAGAA